jgi:alkylated DNA repair dioxygenase AlkB
MIEHHQKVFAFFSLEKDVVDNIPFHTALWKGKEIPHLIFNYSCLKPVETPISFLDRLSRLMNQNGWDVTTLGIWANLYQNGNDWIEWHQDSMTQKKTTYIVSFGAPRVILFREIATNIITAYTLNHGDVLIYDEQDNQKYFHSVPQMPDVSDPRVSIVFS